MLRNAAEQFGGRNMDEIHHGESPFPALTHTINMLSNSDMQLDNS
jgi:hypothetical protein